MLIRILNCLNSHSTSRPFITSNRPHQHPSLEAQRKNPWFLRPQQRALNAFLPSFNFIKEISLLSVACVRVIEWTENIFLVLGYSWRGWKDSSCAFLSPWTHRNENESLLLMIQNLYNRFGDLQLSILFDVSKSRSGLENESFLSIFFTGLSWKLVIFGLFNIISSFNVSTLTSF